MNDIRQTFIQQSTLSWPKLLGELVWVLAGMLLWLGVFVIGENSALVAWLAPIRLILGLLIVIYFPGYCLQVALFPRQGDLDNIERVGLSLGLSIAWVSVLALILNGLPTALSFEATVVGMLISTLIFMITAVFRRAFIAPDKLYQPTPLQPKSWWQGLNFAERRIIGGALVAILLMGGGLAVSLTAVSSQNQLTEFYMLGEAGLAENFPREAVINEPVSVLIGINHLEETSETYRIDIVQRDVWSGQAWLVESFAIGELSDGDEWQQPVHWIMPESGANQQVSIYLFIEGQDSPHRELRLWLDVEEQ